MASCAAVGCSNYQRRNPDLSFFRLPMNKEVASRWIVNIKRVDIPKNVFLCEHHFEKDCFDRSADLRHELLGGSKKRRLVPGAVPTIFAHKPLAVKRAVIEKLEKKRLVSEALKDAEAREEAEALKKAQELEEAEALKKQIEEVKRIKALKQIEAQKKVEELLKKAEEKKVKETKCDGCLSAVNDNIYNCTRHVSTQTGVYVKVKACQFNLQNSYRSKYVQTTNKSRSVGTQTNNNSITSYHIECICKTFGIPELKAAIIDLIQQHASKKMILSPFLEEGNTTSRTTPSGIQSNRMDLEKENDISLNIKKKKQKDPMVNFTSLLPEGVRNMKELNRDMFTVSTVFPCIKCRPISCEKISSIFRRKLLKRPNFKRIRKGQDGDERSKIILLRPDITSMEEFTTSQKSILDEEGAMFTRHAIELTYKDFNLEEILKKVLPEDTEESFSSFETVGHIAHVNLREDLLDFKHVIGTVVMDKNLNVKTVVNKTVVEETFGFSKLKILCGKDNMFATVQEYGCVFEFDYSKVYWNSRLHNEHKRIVEMLNPNDVVFDVFAGVGPFSIPAAKKKCVVYANDLNEFSYEALVHNAELNNVCENVKCFNMDGRDFLNEIVCKELCSISHNITKHIVMNLPALAPTFLDVFKEKYDNFDIPLTQCNNVFVHCYCFSKSKTPQEDAEVLVSESIGLDISTNAKTHLVRRVAPNKVLMCVSFKLYWFESKCMCEDGEALVTRKRPGEGDFYPVIVEKSRRSDK